MIAVAKATMASALAAATKMRTAVVILNWNTEGFLRKFLPALLRAVRKVEGSEVVVADNASSDGSLEVMKALFPDVTTIAFEKNLGFTGGYNEAFNILSKGEDPEYFLLINSDIEVDANFLRPLVDWMDSHPDCAACAPKLHSYQEREKFEYAGAAGGYLDRYGYPFCRGRVMGRIETDHGQYDQATDVLWASGACLMLRSKVFKEMGGLDRRFFAHMEEIDLCWRMQLHGHKISIVADSVVYHLGGGTLPSSSPFKLKLNYRNSLLMLENNLARTYALKLFKEGAETEKASVQGLKMARRTIRMRKFLDYLSAIVYLLSFKLNYFKAVLQAHRELDSKRYGKKEIAEYLRAYGEKASVTGIYKKWIILQNMLFGDKVFGKIDAEEFYKI